MNMITKEMCVAFIKDHYKGEVFSAFVLSVAVLAALGLFLREIVVCIIAAVAAILLLAGLSYRMSRQITGLDLNSFYLVEAPVTKVKKRFGLWNSQIKGWEYTCEFEGYGQHTVTKSIYPKIKISLHKNVISHSDVDKLAMREMEKGSIFYLLISEEIGGEKIIKCFPKFYFEIKADDFELADGKYRCKE